jgi:hypothetical protein
MLIPWGVAVDLFVVLPAYNGDDYVLAPTIAAGDFQISLNGGTFGNLTNTPTAVPGSSGQVRIQLVAAETEASRIVIRAIDQTATKEWKDNAWEHHTPVAEGVTCGKITSGTPTTTTLVSSQLTGGNTNQYADAYITFLTGTCAGCGPKKISAFNFTTDTLTFAALPAAPSVGDVFVLVSGA